MAATAGKAWRPPASYVHLTFVEFVVARQQLLLARRADTGNSRRDRKPGAAEAGAATSSPVWTSDCVLQRARFCNIDRKDDAVTAELVVQLRWHTLAQLPSSRCWGLRECVLLCAALRFTGSRRGEAALLAVLVEAGRRLAVGRAGGQASSCGPGADERVAWFEKLAAEYTSDPEEPRAVAAQTRIAVVFAAMLAARGAAGLGSGKAGAPTPLSLALELAEVRCGSGTYQLSLNRAQVAGKIEQMATAVLARLEELGRPFHDVQEASDVGAFHEIAQSTLTPRHA
jgi:hypothetical protein